MPILDPFLSCQFYLQRNYRTHVFQGTFETVRYEIIGDDAAPAMFQINQQSGLITVAGELARDQQTRYVIRVRAFDNGVPSKMNVTSVIVNVNHNLQCPSWKNADVNANIMETLGIASEVARVEAEDRDSAVSSS